MSLGGDAPAIFAAVAPRERHDSQPAFVRRVIARNTFSELPEVEIASSTSVG